MLVVYPFRHTFIKTILKHCFRLAVNVESSTTDCHVQRKPKVAWAPLYYARLLYCKENRPRTKQEKSNTNKEQRTVI